MDPLRAAWPQHFGLTTCPADRLEQALPAAAWGVAVISGPGESGDLVYLVIESRAGSLLSQCQRRLQSGKLPPVATLSVAFKAEVLEAPSPEAVQAACRQQVLLASELRRGLRPAMR
ncbi:MAG TPA: hypothetical protein PKX00_03265 [Opitutaceae bacterium]|nr:hypothetical protein [Opitutaceae bacterium]